MFKKRSVPARNVLVTGAGGGLGLKVAEAFAARGETVVCVDVNGEQVRKTANSISTSGGKAVALIANIAEQKSVDQLVTDVHAAVGPVAVLANVAGVMDRRQLRELTMDDFSRVVAVNLTGTYGMIRAFEEDLRTVSHGRIVNVASQSGGIGYEFPAYSTSKAAVIHLTRALMLDFWGTDVRINAVSPGPMETPMLNDSMLETFEAATPTGRISQPEEVAEVICQLADPEQRLVNGQNLVIDGGATSFFRWISSDDWMPPYQA